MNEEQNDWRTRILPPSPQVTSMLRYGEIPIGHATGIPQITIPIFTIKLGEFSLPIALSYHASGVKVNDVSSVVGLGWILQAGGVISRQINGAPDLCDLNNDYYNYDRFKEMICGMTQTHAGEEILDNIICGDPNSPDESFHYDTEVDRFAYNFVGKSGVFRYDEEEKVYVPCNFSRILIECKGKKIETIFRIVDTDGIEYVFAKPEITGVKNEEGNSSISAWYLTEINTPAGCIKFNYMNSEEYFQFYESEFIASGRFILRDNETLDFDNWQKSIYNGQTTEFVYKTPVVSSIEWKGNRIDFSYANDRADIWKTRLQQIAVVNCEDKIIKKVVFDNDSYYGTTDRNKRMMLRGITINGIERYTFAYNENNGELPDYRMAGSPYLTGCGLLSCSSDYWGYYNGKHNKSSIPSEAYKDSITRVNVEPGYKIADNLLADRNPNYFYTQFGTLTSITYPTGGRTEFEYEGNDNGEKYGGLRIHAVSNYDGNDLLERKEYDYLSHSDTSDHPLHSMSYPSFHTTNMLGCGVNLDVATDDQMCVGRPLFPISYLHPCLYTRIREKFLNGESIEYEYTTYPEPSVLCGHMLSGKQPLTTYAMLNDYGELHPNLLAKTVFDENGNMLKKEQYTYEGIEVKTFYAGLKFISVLKNATIADKVLSPHIMKSCRAVGPDTVCFGKVFVHSCVSNLLKKETIDCQTGITITEQYTYDPKLRNNQPQTYSIKNSDGKLFVTEYDYAFDKDDNSYKEMAELYNVLDVAVETRLFCDSQFLMRYTTTYKVHNGWMCRDTENRQILNGDLFEVCRYAEYDDCANPLKVIVNGCDTDEISWGYDGMHPICYRHNGMLHKEYEWIPLLGLSTIKDKNGYVQKYKYDENGNLSEISDISGVRQSFSYHYRNSIDLVGGDTDINQIVKETILSADNKNKYVAIDCYDGIGRNFDIMRTDNEEGCFLHTFCSYDNKGRKKRTWKPVVGTQNPCAVNEEEIVDLSFSSYNDSITYNELIYDALDRTLYASTPGENWQGKGKTTEYITNDADSVKSYSAPIDRISLVDCGFYDAGTLYATKQIDEDGHSLIVYTDKRQRKILERREDGVLKNDTYFVYNDLDQLRYVLSPEYQNAGYKDKYAYEYRYDERGNLVKKILPGCEYEQYWYDSGNYLVFMQDATLRERSLYRFFVYDNEGRVVVQGTCAECSRSETPNRATFCGSDGLCRTGYNIEYPQNLTNPKLEMAYYYDNYSFFALFSEELDGMLEELQLSESLAKGQQTGCVEVASNGDRIIKSLFYNDKGLLDCCQQVLVGKRLTTTNILYSYTGSVNETETQEYDITSGVKRCLYTLRQENDYSEITGKLVATNVIVNGKETKLQYEYDKLGRLASIIRNNIPVTYKYNLHGWITEIDSAAFNEFLHYTDGVGNSCYNGNISSILWQTPEYEQIREYKFIYDRLDRMTDSLYGERQDLSDKQNRYNENVLKYTANGAIKRFQRRGLKDDGEYGKIDNLTITLNGNQLLKVEDDANGVDGDSVHDFNDGAHDLIEYSYNGVGALTCDKNRGIDKIDYDNLNNPQQISFANGDVVSYVYSASGIKLSVVADNIGGKSEKEYSGNAVYMNGNLEKLQFPWGYCTFDKVGLPLFHFFVKDHLEDNRAVIDENGNIEQINHYYPFGGIFEDAGLNQNQQQMKYNGKEFDNSNGLNTYDYGARQYFPALPIWDRIDMLCEDTPNVSPYAYAKNNPLRYIDIWGLKDYEYSSVDNENPISIDIALDEVVVLGTRPETNVAKFYFNHFLDYISEVRGSNEAFLDFSKFYEPINDGKVKTFEYVSNVYDDNVYKDRKLTKRQSRAKMIRTVGKNGYNYLKLTKGLGRVLKCANIYNDIVDVSFDINKGHYITLFARISIKGSLIFCKGVPVVGFGLGVVESYYGDYLYEYIDKTFY